MNIMRNKILSLLVLLLTAATGAWAQTTPHVYTTAVAISSLNPGDVLAPGFSLTPASNLDVIYFDANRSKQDDSPMGSQWAVSLSYIKSYGENAAMTFTTPSDPPSDLTATPVDASGNDGNAWEVTLVGITQGTYTIRLSGIYYDPPIEVNEVNPVTVSGATKQWEFDMPASDVLLTPVYAPVAAFTVENAGTANEKTLLPAAADGVIAGQDVAIVTAGTTAQGTVMYLATTDATMTAAQAAIASDWSDALPKATVLTGNVSKPTTVYVWYYIAGADTPQGQTATAENTFNDSELCTAPLEVTLLPNVYTLTLSPAPVDKDKVTVTVDGTAATGAEYQAGKIEAVPINAEVKLNAQTGYKFRTVDVKKDANTTVAVTTNATQAGAPFTEATFTMPAFDATATYDLVRDMSINMTTKVGNDPDGAEIRICVKKGYDGWQLADYTDINDIVALFTVHDGIENKDLVYLGTEAVCTLKLYFLNEQDEPVLALTDPDRFIPGRYKVIATAKAGSAYIGQTEASNVVEFFQGYEVTVPKGEYITYYRDEHLRLDDADRSSIELYTISSVSGSTATLSGPFDALPKNTPMLVHNKGTEDKTFFLIPCDEPDLAFSVAPEFKGTLTATTIEASTDNISNYAFNGKQFVIVRSDLDTDANKCWLSVTHETGGTQPGSSSARSIKLVFDNGTTGLKAIDNGQLTMDNWYDLNGRKLSAAPKRKGVYIKNGQKVVVK